MRLTENKRFCIEESILKEGFVIRDKGHEYSFPVLESGMNFMFNKALNELHDENEQLKSEKQAIIDILDEMENGDDFWDRDYLIECISDIETAIGVDLDD